MTQGQRARLLTPTAVVTVVLSLLGPGCGNTNEPTPTAFELASVTLSSPTVIGGGSVQGTVTLTRAATASTVVALSSANPTVVVVPQSVSVAAGSTSATFTVTTGTVAASTPVVITGSFAANRTVTLTVTTGLTASFTVSSTSRGNNGCTLNVGGGSLDCAFNASASTGAITSYEWTTTIGPNVFNQPATTVTIATPSTNGCGLFAGQTGGGASTLLQMIVRLRVRDAAGNTAESTNNNVSVLPRAGACGF
jgi:hypothetical protein